MHRDMGRPSFAEALVAESLGHNQRLERIDDAVDWERLGQVVAGVHAAARGRPGYPPLLMVQALLLQQWYGLSDPQLEEALGDRLSFRRFVGLSLEDATPDHSTISRFRQALEVQELSAPLFTELAAQRDAQGLVLKQNTLLVRRAVLTPANVYESEVADALVSGDERAVSGDRAYESTRRRQWLREQGIADRIMHRANQQQPELPAWPQQRNAWIAPRRAWVEKVFGTLKRSDGYHRVRYRGVGRNTVELWFKLMAYNLRKADTLAWAAS